MNKSLAIILIILALGVGFGAGNMAKKGGAGAGSINLKLAQEVIGNPIVPNITLEGKVAAIDKDILTLEKDGKQLKVYISADSTFTKLSAPAESGATSSAATAISELQAGSEVIGGGTIKMDANTSEYKIYTTNFWVK